ncbi:hypothetical protein [Klebsiella sp. KE9767]|uniref:hypothetical protein n=1 Tax=Klebsiella sp. KE9767 TaxID=3118151 RepID=UPI0037504B80
MRGTKTGALTIELGTKVELAAASVVAFAAKVSSSLVGLPVHWCNGILISLVSERNDEFGATVFSRHPLALPLQGREEGTDIRNNFTAYGLSFEPLSFIRIIS